jgi:NTE family protein
VRLLLAAIALSATQALGAVSPCPAPRPASAAPPAAPALPAGTRVGLALGSGSMHGYAHIGVIEELEARKLPVAVVAGTSVGALVGALWASGLTGGEVEALGRREDITDVGRIAGSWQGILTTEPWRAPLEASFRGRPIEAWPRRFVAVATSIGDGGRRLITTGDGVLAVQASSAMPVLYSPVVVRGERLADGALVEPVPVKAARDVGANLVIGVDVAYRPDEEEVSGMAGYAFQSLHILVNALAAEQAAAADVTIRLNVHRRLMDCGRDGLVEAGREAVRRAWPEILRAISKRRTGK